MSRRLYVTDEFRDRLTDLKQRDPSAAWLAGDAVLALLDEVPGPPLVIPADLLAWGDDPGEALRHAYERQILLRQKVRRASADVTTARKRLEIHIQQLVSEIRRLGDQIRMAAEAGRRDLAHDLRARQAGLEDALPGLRGDHSDLAAVQEKAILAGQRVERALAEWRARKEAVGLRHLTGRAQDRIDEALNLALTRTHALAGVRHRRGFTVERIAERMNVTRERVAEIEAADPDALELGTLAAYLEAIGGRLEIVADLGTERITLR